MPFPDDIDVERPSPLEQLQIAFACSVAREIVAADGLLDIEEVRLLTLVFPDRLMRNCRFLGPDDQLTDAFHRAYVESVRVLSKVLDTGQKLDLITLFHRTCVVDGELHPKEVVVLRASANTLGVDPEVVRRHVNGLHRSLTSLRR